MESNKSSGLSFAFVLAVLLALGIGVTALLFIVRYENELKDRDITAGQEEQVSGIGNVEKAGFGTRLGQKALDFTLTDQNGKKVSLHDYEGKVILLDITAAWCPPCRAEADDSMRMYRANEAEGFVIVSVLVESENREPATPSDARRWADAYGITYPVLADTDRWVWNRYNEKNAFPLNLIIDRDLVIKFKRVGFRQGMLDTAVQQVMAQ